MMVEIAKGDSVFFVELEQTREYYLHQNLCDCCCCRNLYAQIKSALPELDAFLSEFGADITRPDEAASLEMEDTIQYLFVGYTVTGSMITPGCYETVLDGYKVTVSADDYFPNQQTAPHFFICMEGPELPWVLDEPFPETIPFSPPPRLIDRIKGFFRKSDTTGGTSC